MFIKQGDRFSTLAKRLYKLNKSSPRELPESLRSELRNVKSKAKIKDIIRGYFGQHIGVDPKGFIYRSGKGGFTGVSGVEASLKGARNDLTWVSPSADAALNYSGRGGKTFRMPIPPMAKGVRVTRPEGDIRGALHHRAVSVGDKGVLETFNPAAHRRSPGLEAVIERAPLDQYIKSNPSVIEELKLLKVPDGGVTHRALMSSKGDILGTGIPLKPSFLKDNPVLRKAVREKPTTEWFNTVAQRLFNPAGSV